MGGNVVAIRALLICPVHPPPIRLPIPNSSITLLAAAFSTPSPVALWQISFCARKTHFRKKGVSPEVQFGQAMQVFYFSNNFIKTLKNKIFENTFVFLTGKMP